jgi:hypothetical protein
MSPALKQCAVSVAVAMLLLAGCLEKTKTPVTDESKTRGRRQALRNP